jgi:lipopolysaccharide/colanic/teichoic acid biosynthesis glycosyltransferase
MNLKLRCFVLGADLICIAAGCAAANGLQGGTAFAGPARSFQWIYMLAAFCVWSVLYMSKKLEGFQGGWHIPRISAQVTVGVLYTMGSSLGLMFLFDRFYSLRALLGQALVLLLGFIGIRCLVRWLLASPPYGGSKRRVIILGTGRIVHELAMRISRHPETAMQVAGVLSPSDADSAQRGPRLPPGTISVRTMNVLDLMAEKRVKELIVVEPLPPGMETEKLITGCRNAGIRVHLVPQRYELYLSKARLMEIDGIPLLSLHRQALPVLGMKLKRAMDLVGASFLLVFCAPVLAFFTLLLHARKGQGLKPELRCGKNGRPFWLYRLNVDRDAPNLSCQDRLLLQLSLTELPQLWNVLRGEMSLVGPRPEWVERVKHYSSWQRQRLNVTPGMTGLAQVHGLREQHSSEEKARFDLEYIFHWSVFLDLSLLVQTLWILFVRGTRPDAFRAAAPPFQAESA